MTKIYGHRGRAGTYPENSMLAFEEAVKAGVHGLELDVHMTKDGEVVVIHDATIDRTTSGSGYVRDYTLAELEKFSIGAKYQEFKNYESSWNKQHIPTLMDVLKIAKAHDLEVNIELKSHEVEYLGFEEAVLKTVAATGIDPQKIIYSAFHLPTILRLKKLDEFVQIAWLLETMIPLPADYLETFNLDAFHLDKKLVLEHPEYWRPFAKKIRIWTVNEKADAQALINLGVAAIISDYPETLLEMDEYGRN